MSSGNNYVSSTFAFTAELYAHKSFISISSVFCVGIVLILIALDVTEELIK